MTMDREAPQYPTTQRRQEAELARTILGLIEAQPQAVPLDAITEWWLARRPAQVGVEAVARVVSRLVAEGVLEEIGDEGARLYRLKVPEGEPPEPRRTQPEVGP